MTIHDIKVLPGRLSVLVDTSDELVLQSGLILTKEAAHLNEMLGHAEEVLEGIVVSSGVDWLQPGQTVVLRSKFGHVVYTPSECEGIPEGMELRIYGVHDPLVWTDAMTKATGRVGQDVVIGIKR